MRRVLDPFARRQFPGGTTFAKIMCASVDQKPGFVALWIRELCDATPSVQAVWRILRGVGYVAQAARHSICGANDVVQTLWCKLRSVSYVVQATG
eukprot:9484880-Pyramimonas_sp.AAC.1